ncbi:MAG: MFS transporter [bacterium]|nr:MFS transporter [bacterium]
MHAKLTDAEKIRLLPWSIAHNAANNVFAYFTVFGSVFILFLNELGLPKTQIGFLLSLFPFCGILALFIAPTIAHTGFKRTFIIFWGLRKLVIAFLLLAPWILSRFGIHVTFIYMAGILLVFAICRAIGETAYYPWFQEVVPDSIRGKYTAIDNIFITLTGSLAIAVASYVVGRSLGLSRFMILIGAGVVFGLIAVCFASFIPGGAPVRDTAAKTAHFKQMMNVLHDRNFLFYNGGIGAVTVVSVGLLSFVPLFMKEQVGLSSSNVVLLQIGTLFGGLLSGYLWGWSADRYGSKPIMLSGLHLMVLLPVCWLLMPRHSAWSSSLAMSIAFLGGAASIGLMIGSGRLLYVGVVPTQKKTEYMAVYYAWIGLVGGCSQLIAGRSLDYFKGMGGNFFNLTLDPYTPLFVVSFILLIVGALLIRQVRVDSDMPTGKFACMFLHGNPFVAIGSVVRFYLAKEEGARVSTTEHLGEAKSPLNIDELLHALSDPSFNVRYEAIISISRTRPDDRLVNALIQVLSGDNPDLSIAAAWALGRIGDKTAIEPLHKTLVSGYPLLQARSARALATLDDAQAIPLLLERFKNEPNCGLRIAYASALGTLRATEATDGLLTLLQTLQDECNRMELALALARIVGNEHYFVRLWRRPRSEIGTAASQAMLSLKRRIKKFHRDSDNFMTVLDDCAEALAENDLQRGTTLLSDVIDNLPVKEFGKTFAAILKDCAERLDEFGASRIEYLILSLHTIDAALNSVKN